MSKTHELRKWEMRGQSRWFCTAFLFYGVALNPMIWWLGRFDPTKTRLFNDVELVQVLILANTIMTVTTFVILRKMSKFDLFDLGMVIFVGLLVAVVTTPFLFAFISWLQMEHWGLEELFNLFMGVLLFGWLLMAIPFFAANYGVPCAITFYFIAIILCRRVAEENSDVSKPIQTSQE